MKKIIYILILLLIICTPVFAEDYTYIPGEDEYNKNVSDIMSGDFKINPSDFIRKTLSLFFDEIINSRSLIADIMVIAAISGILNVLETSFNKTSDTAFFACFSLISIALLKLFSEACGYGSGVIKTLTGFITKICPILTILLVSSGSAASAGSFYPVLSASIYTVSEIIEKCVIPLIYMSAILGIVNNLTNRIQLTNLNNLIKSFARWILTGILTVFTGINAIYGFSVPVLDAVSLKALKFTVGSLVPVVGNLVADTVETVITGAKLMKNAVGTAGIIAVIAICLVPVLKLAAIIFMLKIAAAAAEPITDSRISNMINDIISPITTVFSMVIATSMLFIISIAIIIGAT